MRVAMFHTTYAQPGGEDLSVALDIAQLRESGTEVLEYRAANPPRPGIRMAQALWRSNFNRRVYEDVRAFCRRHRPSIAHVQNFWYALSPSVHAACHAEQVPTVQTLRNYRLLCVNALLMRNGQPCEACVGHAPWRGVAYGCYRESRASSLLVARMIVDNRRRRTWLRNVDSFIALTPFARDRFVFGGLPADRIAVRPNSVADPGEASAPGYGAVYVGRLSAEKGVDILLNAWQHLPDVPLTIAGDGPLRDVVIRAVDRLKNVSYSGQATNAECLAAIKRAATLVMASRWYEGFPRVIVEAYATGRPVIAPRLGSMADLVRDGVTGLLFEPGSFADLARCVTTLRENPDLAREMGKAARLDYERRYAPESTRQQLLDIYRGAAARFESSS